MAPHLLDKLTACRILPHDWRMSLGMDLAALCDLWSEDGTNAWHLASFNEDIAFSCHFVATHLPPTLPPYRSASGIGYTSKKLFKMPGNSARYSPNSWWID